MAFFRVQKLKFHGEEQSVLGDFLIRFAAIGMFAYSTFNIVAGGLSVHSDPKNLLVLATGGITIIQVYKNIVTYLRKLLFKSLLFFAGDAPIVVHN